MGLFMKADSALLRVVIDDACPVMARVNALKQVQHPPLIVLRSLIVETETPRLKPVPVKLKTLAALKYAEEVTLRARKKAMTQKSTRPNPLGI